jgi:hypothetical protein
VADLLVEELAAVGEVDFAHGLGNQLGARGFQGKVRTNLGHGNLQ